MTETTFARDAVTTTLYDNSKEGPVVAPEVDLTGMAAQANLGLLTHNSGGRNFDLRGATPGNDSPLP